MKGNSFMQRPDKKKLLLADKQRNVLRLQTIKETRKQSFVQQNISNNIEQQNKQIEPKHHTIIVQQTRKISQCQGVRRNQRLSTISTTRIIARQQQTGEALINQKTIQRRKSSTPFKQRDFAGKNTEIFQYKQSQAKSLIFKNQITEIISLLTESYVIQSKSQLQIWMKKQAFSQLINFLLLFLVQKQDEATFQPKWLLCLGETFKKIKEKVNNLQQTKKARKIKLQSATIDLKYDSQSYQDQIDYFHNGILSLKKQKQILQQTITRKEEQLQTITELCKEKLLIIKDYERKHFQLAEIILSQTQNLQKVEKQLTEKQVLLEHISEKTDQILNYAERQQEKKILLSVSEAYKQIQSDIYDYATYLQCNAMASSITWEPKPFRAVQKWVYEQLERVNKFVMSAAESIQDKSAKMKNFITNTTRKFRTKDQQMMQITDYKTECIKKFIKMMQKWLENWELKQEYLVGLRNQFAIKSQKIDQIISDFKLMDTSIGKDGDAGEVKEKINALQVLWKAVELNYKYGNSFY